MTLDQPSNVNAIKKPLSGLKNVPKRLMKHFRGFGSGFPELHTKIDANMLLNFAIHRRKKETHSQKSTRVKTMCVHRAVSRGRLMKTGLRKCDLGLPSHLLSPRQLKNNIPGTF
jgi:hypothetical protein